MSSHQVEVRGLRLAYDDLGRGQTIVLLHGFPFNRSLWREQAETLASRYRVVTPDLRGFGETAGGEGDATMEEMAQDIVALLDELKIDRVVLGGLSMGGYVSLAFYRRFPLRVRALILADTRPQADSEEGKRNRAELAGRVLSEGLRPVADSMLPKLFSSRAAAEMPEAVERVRAMIMSTNPEGAAAALRGMAARRDHTNFLQEILAPTLIIVGREDAITPPADAEVMHREIRGSRLEVIEHAGHVSNIERPAEFSRALESFLAELLP